VPAQGEIAMTMKIVAGMTAAAGTKEGTKKLSCEYEKVDMSMKMGENDLMAGVGADMLKKMEGMKYDVIMNADGKPIDVEGLDKAMKDMPPQMASFMKKDQLLAQFEQMGLIGVPKAPVAKGESWEFASNLPSPTGKMSLKGKYTYIGDETVAGAKCAVAELDSVLTMDFAAPPKDKKETPEETTQREMLEKLGMKVEGATMKGKVYFDPKLQNIRKSEVEMKMVMKMKNPGSGEAMEMPSATSISMTMDAKDAE
jgi:hypothetical protein